MSKNIESLTPAAGPDARVRCAPGRSRLRVARATVCALGLLALGGCQMPLMQPSGAVGLAEKNLILIATGMMLLVVVPVIFLTLFFAWRYRASNTNATYAPKWSHSNAIEIIVWAIPIVIIALLGVLIWHSTHALDPYKPLKSDKAPLRVDVVAMNWKWLFIYPDLHVATVNELHIPVGTPVAFKLTSASIMNSFFIPSLGSQVYTMPGMQTQLHLIADRTGAFPGMSASFSGAGFADMHFSTVSSTQADFEAWAKQAQQSPRHLDQAAYAALAQDSIADPVRTYAAVDPALFARVVDQYMRKDMVAREPVPMARICTTATRPVAAAAPSSMPTLSMNDQSAKPQE